MSCPVSSTDYQKLRNNNTLLFTGLKVGYNYDEDEDVHQMSLYNNNDILLGYCIFSVTSGKKVLYEELIIQRLYRNRGNGSYLLAQVQSFLEEEFGIVDTLKIDDLEDVEKRCPGYKELCEDRRRGREQRQGSSRGLRERRERRERDRNNSNQRERRERELRERRERELRERERR